jgi:hypothetical protein
VRNIKNVFRELLEGDSKIGRTTAAVRSCEEDEAAYTTGNCLRFITVQGDSLQAARYSCQPDHIITYASTRIVPF